MLFCVCMCVGKKGNAIKHKSVQLKNDGWIECAWGRGNENSWEKKKKGGGGINEQIKPTDCGKPVAFSWLWAFVRFASTSVLCCSKFPPEHSSTPSTLFSDLWINRTKKKCLAPSHRMENEQCHRQLPPLFVNAGDCDCWNAGGITVQSAITTALTTIAEWCWASRRSDGHVECAIKGGWLKKNTSDLKIWCRPSLHNLAFLR